jgi:GNAT superfamily N-acetyltransferase
VSIVTIRKVVVLSFGEVRGSQSLGMEIQYRFMKGGEESQVCSLVERVFHELVAPDYGPEGIHEFFQFANPKSMAERAGPEQVIVIAEQGADLVGMIEMRRCDHIALLFVSRRRQGIAKKLLRKAVQECRHRKPDVRRITVNSSPFAEPIYRRMGFTATGPVQEKNGILFVPMVCDCD